MRADLLSNQSTAARGRPNSNDNGTHSVQKLARIAQTKIGRVFVIRNHNISILGNAAKAAVASEAGAVFGAYEVNWFDFCL